jgi:hypothetical protein
VLKEADEYLHNKYSVVKLEWKGDLNETVKALADKLHVSVSAIRIYQLVPLDGADLRKSLTTGGGSSTSLNVPKAVMTARGWESLNVELEELPTQYSNIGGGATHRMSEEANSEKGEEKKPLTQLVHSINQARGRNRLEKVVLWYKLVQN